MRLVYHSAWSLPVIHSFHHGILKLRHQDCSTESLEYSKNFPGRTEIRLRSCHYTDFCSDAVLVDATLNSLSSLIRTRPHITNKILNAILNFNPLKLANSPMTPKSRVMAKSMEKTTRLLMIHVNKRYEHDCVTPRLPLIPIVIRKTRRRCAYTSTLSVLYAHVRKSSMKPARSEDLLNLLMALMRRKDRGWVLKYPRFRLLGFIFLP